MKDGKQIEANDSYVSYTVYVIHVSSAVEE